MSSSISSSEPKEAMIDAVAEALRPWNLNAEPLSIARIAVEAALAAAPDYRRPLQEVAWFLRDCEKENVFGPGPHPRFDGLRRDVDAALVAAAWVEKRPIPPAVDEGADMNFDAIMDSIETKWVLDRLQDPEFARYFFHELNMRTVGGLQFPREQ